MAKRRLNGVAERQNEPLFQRRDTPADGFRREPASKLDKFSPYLKKRFEAGVWNATALLRELRQRGYSGGYNLLAGWMRSQWEEMVVQPRRLGLQPGRRVEVEWGRLGTLHINDQERNLWGVAFTLGYSGRMTALAALDQKLGTLLHAHEEAFRELGGVPRQILYGRMKGVWQETDEPGETIWNRVFLDFANYWGFTPQLGPSFQTCVTGAVESGLKYIRADFPRESHGCKPAGLEDLNAQLREWVRSVANERAHVRARWDVDQLSLQKLNSRPPYPYAGATVAKERCSATRRWMKDSPHAGTSRARLK